MRAETTLDRPAAWTDLLAVLATCLRRPDADLVEAVQRGHLQDALERTVAALDLQPAPKLEPPATPSVGALTTSYLALFDAMETPYAPLAESPYKPWYGGRAGLLEGPPAADMSRRYAAMDATVPAGYPADHAALLLEYGTWLLEVGEVGAFDAYQDAHFDWFPALRLAVDGARAGAPFHRWAVRLLDDVTATLRTRLGGDPVDGELARTMVGRVGDATSGEPRSGGVVDAGQSSEVQRS